MLKIKLSEALKIQFSYKITWSPKITILALLKMLYECLFGMAVKFLTQVPLQCPHSFWKLLLSVPMSTQPSPFWAFSPDLSQQQCQPLFVGTRVPGHPTGRFPWDFPRIQESCIGNIGELSLPMILLQTQSPLPKPPSHWCSPHHISGAFLIFFQDSSAISYQVCSRTNFMGVLSIFY